MDRITMTMRELSRLKVIEVVIEERLMPWRARYQPASQARSNA
ncbi:hypothetical protein SAMN05414139_04826 [Burkholderia sp. D7]|nr:hypothetical protein SAMN05414139_04826 [Burkholderia sp. D7]